MLLHRISCGRHSTFFQSVTSSLTSHLSFLSSPFLIFTPSPFLLFSLCPPNPPVGGEGRSSPFRSIVLWPHHFIPFANCQLPFALLLLHSDSARNAFGALWQVFFFVLLLLISHFFFLLFSSSPFLLFSFSLFFAPLRLCVSAIHSSLLPFFQLPVGTGHGFRNQYNKVC